MSSNSAMMCAKAIKMQGQGNGVHILSIPFPAVGHILSHVDLLHQLLLRGITVTVVVTPKNLHYLNPLLSFQSSNALHILVFPFPSTPSLPHGVENLQDVPYPFAHYFVTALAQLYDPLVQWFGTHPSPPNAIISDFLFSSWTNCLASHLNIKNLAFTVINAYAMFPWMAHSLKVKPDPNAPSTKLHLGCVGSWGLIFNTFTELDGDKINMMKEEFIKHDRVWAVGPLVPLEARVPAGSNTKGGQSSIPPDQVIAWLDSCQNDNSVVYVAFGTNVTLSKGQMEAVASALEESGVHFIWALKDPMKGTENEDDQNVIPRGFKERVAGRGLLIKGWSPQLAILEHRAVGSFLTHCGWNSVVEALLRGVLLLAWPMQIVDHFGNSKVLVDELGVAIRVCEGVETIPDSTKLARILSESVSMDLPERLRAMKLRETALAAIRKGGSSDKALDGLVEALCSLSVGMN